MSANTILTPPPPDNVLLSWVGKVFGGAIVAPLRGDASARRYFRAKRGDETRIVMHSPQSEKPKQFLAVREFLESLGARAPKLFAADSERGFILLEDFGDSDYLSALSAANRDSLYAAALRELIKMQTAAPPAFLPVYDETALRAEMNLFPEWFCARYVQKPLSAAEQKVFDCAANFLIQECANQPQVFVHRDYHSRNLMHLGESSPGILDFQDALVGPAAYDVVSLFRDAYISLPRTLQKKLLEKYRRLAKECNAPVQTNARDLIRDFNVAGAQRGLKVLGIFARLHYRDGKSAYLSDIPRVRAHLFAACAALPELAKLAEILRAAPLR